MGKVLKVFVIIIFLLAIAAAYLAHSLFGKRELLTARTLTLQRGIEQVSRTIEAEQPEEPSIVQNFPEKDISPVSEPLTGNPRRTQFWQNYRPELEQLDQDMLNIGARRRELMSYYRRDPVTNKREIDPVTGAPVTDGPGTMRGVIEDIVTAAGNQYNVLTATRQQLKMLREELVATINEFNDMKEDLREKNEAIEDLEQEKQELENSATAAQREVALEKERTRELERTIEDLEQEKLIMMEESDSLKFKNEELVEVVTGLRAQIEDMRSVAQGAQTTAMADGDQVATGAARVDLTVGQKGSVASVDDTHNFVVLNLDDAFVNELLTAAESANGQLPMVELIVQRQVGGDVEFIAKVRLTQLKQSANLAIGDVLMDWQQQPIRVGDEVTYQ